MEPNKRLALKYCLLLLFSILCGVFQIANTVFKFENQKPSLEHYIIDSGSLEPPLQRHVSDFVWREVRSLLVELGLLLFSHAAQERHAFGFPRDRQADAATAAAQEGRVFLP